MDIQIDFWFNSDPDYLPKKTVTDDLFSELEDKYQIKLPNSYKQLLRIQNGGYINYPIFPIKKENQHAALGEEILIDKISGIKGEIKGGISDDLRNSDWFWSNWGLPSKTLVLYSHADNFIVMDYRNHTGDNPPIANIWTDLYVGYDEVIAENFENFIVGLKKEG